MATPRNPMTPPADPGQVRITRVDDWLAEVADRLVGAPRVKDAAVAELRDGLLETVDAYRAGGAAPEQADAAAVAEFGSPATIAKAFAPEFAARQARHNALALIGTGPLIGLLWTFAIASNHVLTSHLEPGPPWHWLPGQPGGLRIASALIGIALVIGIPAGLLAVATTSRLSRKIPDRPKLAPTAAATLGVAGIVVDLTLLTALATTAVTAPARLAWLPLTLAMLASITRVTLNTRATARLLAARAAVA